MTDTRLPDKWLNAPKYIDLSADAWRLFTLAMMWSNQQGTDGAVPSRYVRMLHPDLDPASLIPELTSAGVLEATDEGIRFLDWSGELGQAPAEYVSRKREEARERMRSLRESRRVSGAGVPPNVRTNVGQDTDASQAKDPGSYVPTNVRANTCPKHPNGDTGEPCGTCMKIRQDLASRRPSAGSELRAIAAKCRREGHQYRPGERYCDRCAQPRDPNAWMEPRAIEHDLATPRRFPEEVAS